MYLLLAISFVLQQGCYGEKVIEFNNVVKNVVLLSSPLEIFEVEDEYFCMLEYVTIVTSVSLSTPTLFMEYVCFLIHKE